MDLLFPRDDRERLEFKESALQIGFEELTAECTASINLLQPHDRLSVLMMAWKKIGDYLTHNQYVPCMSKVVNWVGRHTLELWFGRDWISCSSDNKTSLIEYMMKVYPAAYISMSPYSWPYMFSIYRDPWMVDYLNVNFQRMNDPELSEHLDTKDSDFIQQEGLSLIFLRIVNMFDFNMMKLVKHMCRRLLLAWHDTSSTAHRSLRVAINGADFIEYVRHMYLITFNETNGIKDLHYVLECVQRNMHCNAIECSHLDRAAQIIAVGLLECKQTLMEFLIRFLSKVPERQFSNTFGNAINKYKSFLTEYLLRKIHTRRTVGCVGFMPANGIYENLVKMFIKKRESSEDLMKTTAAVSERLFAGVHDLRALKFSYDQFKSLTRVEWFTTKVTLLLGIISEELNNLEDCKYTEGQTADELIQKEQELAIYYRDLSRLLGRTPALEQEAWLTTFSLHPCKEYLDAVTKCGSRNLRAIKKQAIKLKVISEPKPFKATNNGVEHKLSPDIEKSSLSTTENLSIAVERGEFPSTVLASSEPSCSVKEDLETTKSITGNTKRLSPQKLIKTITKGRVKPKSIEKKSAEAIARVSTPIPKKSLNDCRDKDTAEVLYAASAGAGDKVSLQTEQTIKYPEFALVNSVTDTEDVIRYTDYDGEVLAQYRELTRVLSNIRLQYSNYDDLLALLIAPRYKRLTWATCWKNLRKRCRILLTKDNKKKQLVEQCLADANERLTHLQIDYEKYKNKPQIDYGSIEDGYECFDTESGEEGGVRIAGLKRVSKLKRIKNNRALHEQHCLEEEDLSESQLTPDTLQSTTDIQEKIEQKCCVLVDHHSSDSIPKPVSSGTVNIVVESKQITKEIPVVYSTSAQALNGQVSPTVQIPLNSEAIPTIQTPLKAEAASNVQEPPTAQVNPGAQAIPSIHVVPSAQVLTQIQTNSSVRTLPSSVTQKLQITTNAQEAPCIQVTPTPTIQVRARETSSAQTSPTIQAPLRTQPTSSAPIAPIVQTDPRVKAPTSLHETASIQVAPSDQVVSSNQAASKLQTPSEQVAPNIQATRPGVQEAPISQVASEAESSSGIQNLPTIPAVASNLVTPSVETPLSETKTKLNLNAEKSPSHTLKVYIPRLPLKTYSRYRVGLCEKAVKPPSATGLTANKSHKESTPKAEKTSIKHCKQATSEEKKYSIDESKISTSAFEADTNKSSGKESITDSQKAATSQEKSASTESLSLRENQQISEHKSTPNSKDMAHQWGNVSFPEVMDDPMDLDFRYEDLSGPQNPQNSMNQMIAPALSGTSGEQSRHSMGGTGAQSWNYLAQQTTVHQHICTNDQSNRDWTNTVNMSSQFMQGQFINTTTLSPSGILTNTQSQQTSTSYFELQSTITNIHVPKSALIQSIYMPDNTVTQTYNPRHGSRYVQYRDQLQNMPSTSSRAHSYDGRAQACTSMQRSSSCTNPHYNKPLYEVGSQGDDDYCTSIYQPHEEQHEISSSSSHHSMSDLSAESIMGNMQETTMLLTTNMQRDSSMSGSEYIPFTGSEADAIVLGPSVSQHHTIELAQSSSRAYVGVPAHIKIVPPTIHFDVPNPIASTSAAYMVSEEEFLQPESICESTQPGPSAEALNAPFVDIRVDNENVSDGNDESDSSPPHSLTYTYFPPELNTVQIVKPSGTTRVNKMRLEMGQGIRRTVPSQRVDLLRLKSLNKFPNPRWRPFYNCFFKRKLLFVPTEAEVQKILSEYIGQRRNGRIPTYLTICGLTEDNPGEEILDESVIINLTNPKYTKADEKVTDVKVKEMRSVKIGNIPKSRAEIPGHESGVMYKMDKSPPLHFFLGIPTPAYHLSLVCPSDGQVSESHLGNLGGEILTVEPNLVYKMYLFLKEDDFVWEKFPLTRPHDFPGLEDEESDNIDDEKDEERNVSNINAAVKPEFHAVSMESSTSAPGKNNRPENVMVKILNDHDQSDDEFDMSEFITVEPQTSEIIPDSEQEIQHMLELQMDEIEHFPEQEIQESQRGEIELQMTNAQLGQVKPHPEPKKRVARSNLEPRMDEDDYNTVPKMKRKRMRKLVVRLERNRGPMKAAMEALNCCDNRTAYKRSPDESESDSEISLRRSGRYALKVYGAGSRAKAGSSTNRQLQPSTSNRQPEMLTDED